MSGRSDQFLDLSAGKGPRESLDASTGFEESWCDAVDYPTQVQKIEKGSQRPELVRNVIIPPAVGKSAREVVPNIHRCD